MTSDSELSPLKRAIVEIRELRAQLSAVKQREHAEIAVVGMGCRFPGGGNDPDSYWRLLRDGVDTIREVPADRWVVDKETTDDEAATRWGGFLDAVDQFDARFFGISPREAASMDPQQRLLLEVAWEALEDAGIAADRLAGTRDRRLRRHLHQRLRARCCLRGEPGRIDVYVGDRQRAQHRRRAHLLCARPAGAERWRSTPPARRRWSRCTWPCQSLRARRVRPGARRRRQPDPVARDSSVSFSQARHAGRRRPLQDLRRRAPTATCAARAAAWWC